MAHNTLHSAKQQKMDEFYTQLSDIESELKHYKEEFRGKVVFCNCDDPFESNFFKYFSCSFNFLGLKKLIATSFTKSPIAGGQLPLFEVAGLKPDGKQPFKIEISEILDTDMNGAVDISDVEHLLKNDKNVSTPLKENGDFRSKECIELLKQADIVVTNPPFSLFREYVAQLIEHNKRFLIIGNKNCVTYKEIFRLMKDNKIRTGYRNINNDMWFMVPDDAKYEKIVDGQKVKHIMAIWLTNLEVKKHDEDMVLYKKYIPEEYPKYDNYDAINVNVVNEIPADYPGVMGVPITFLDKYNPEQFEIIGLGISNSGIEIGVKPYKEEHKKYRKEIQKRGAVDGDLYMITDGTVDVPYARILIKNKKSI